MTKFKDDLFTEGFESEVAEMNGANTMEYDFDDDDATEFDDDDDDSEFDDDDDDDNFNAEFDDDDDDDAEYDDDDDDAEFLGALGIGKAIKGITRLVTGRRGRRRRRVRVRNRRPARRYGRVGRFPIGGRIQGSLFTRSGKRIPFKLPKNIATKREVAAVRRGVNINGKAIRKNAIAISGNSKNIGKTLKQVTIVDSRHSKATKRQNKVLSRMNRRISFLKKEMDSAKQQAQMQSMMSMFFKPELSSITLANAPAANTAVDVTSSEFDNDMLPMIMAMSGGFGGSGGGNMMNNPMMMFMMMEAMKDD